MKKTDVLELVKPTETDEADVMAYKAELLAHGDAIHGGSCLDEFEHYADWLTDVRNNEHEATMRPGFVPATTWLIRRVSDGRLVGIANLRHRLNKFLLEVGGHLGYGVRPTERRKGYATALTRLVIDEARKLGMEKMLVTCEASNEASRRTIVASGGVLENEITFEGRTMLRHWIDLTS